MVKRALATIDTPDDPAGPADAGEAASRTLIERAYLQLREDILDGRLAPGARLRVEHLKHDYGVGAGTLREAITRLATDALVVAEGQRGFRVAPMALDDLIDLTELRIHIEIDALRRSIRKADASWRARVVAAFQALSAFEQPVSPEVARQWEQLNQGFHATLVSGCDSPWTLRVLHQLHQHGERYRRYAIGLPDTGRDVHSEHLQIFEFALAGQDARAALALEAHIRATPDLLARHPHEGFGALARPEMRRLAARSPDPS